MTRETRDSIFDELASGLASDNLSRRKALRLMGGLLVGARSAPSQGQPGPKTDAPKGRLAVERGA